MQKTTFVVRKMDCPSEEQLVRMTLQPLKSISSLQFDIPKRTLVVHHTGDSEPIVRALDALQLESCLLESTTADEIIPLSNAGTERTLLRQVLSINLFFFALEISVGFVADSMGLVADGLDMLADSLIYGLALFAVGRGVGTKKSIARVSGSFQLLLAGLGIVEVVRRFLGFGDVPAFGLMIGISALALSGNVVSLYLLQRSASKEAHMQASLLCTSNDVIANLGVILAGALVFATHSKIPDLVVGAVVFAVVGRGAYRIFRIAK